MDFYEVLDDVLELLRSRGRVTYRALKRQFNVDDEFLGDLKEEIIYGQKLAVDEDDRVLVWTGDADTTPTASPIPSISQAIVSQTTEPERAPASYTPTYLAEKILTGKTCLEGERKVVTVLFADIKDSTELIRDSDPEDAQKLLDPALHIMMEAVHRFEGTVNQVLGDGIMSIFGAPIAHEDHSARACYAALAMQSAMKDYTDEVRRIHGIPLQIRVGLNSGEVVVRTIGNDLHMDYSAVGQTTNLASRMEQLAAPGSVVLTAAALRLVEGLVQVNALGLIPVKGIDEPVEVYELTGASSVRRRLQATVTRGLTKFVGRDTEIEALNQALERAYNGHGQIVATVGEAGVGKSRLVYEFVHSHRTQGWLVLESASVSYGKATPYFPVVDLLKRYIHVEDGDDARIIRAKVTGQILTLDESLQDTIPGLLSLLDALPEDSPFLKLDPPRRRQRTLNGLKRILLRESQVQPLVLVFEDLHWHDSESRALLDNLVESLPTAQLLLLVNYRPEYQHGWGNKTFYTQLRLDPLPPESADAFLEALMGNDASLASLKPLLIERTEGNPFFLEESVRTLVETQVLIGQPGAYRLVQDLPSIQVPLTVQAVLAARIDRLLQEEKSLLQTASVIGTEVPFTLLQAIAAIPDEALYPCLMHLQATEFLYETSLFPERVYAFKHALTHEVAYGSLLQERRRALHARIAEEIETSAGDRLSEQVERLAHHTLRGEVWDKALVYCRQAGERARMQSGRREAMGYFEQALSALQHLPKQRDTIEQAIELRLTMRTVLRELGDLGRVLALLHEAEALAEALDNPRRLGQVSLYFIVHFSLKGAYDQATAAAQRTFALATTSGDVALDAMANLFLGATCQAQSDYRRAIDYLEQPVAFFDRARRRERFVGQSTPQSVVSRAYLAACHAELGTFTQGRIVGDEGLQVAEADAYLGSLRWALWGLGLLCLRQGDLPRATPLLERAVSICQEANLLGEFSATVWPLGVAYTLGGRVAAAVPLLTQALEQAAVIESERVDQQALCNLSLGEAQMLAGCLEEAQTLVERALVLTREIQERGNEAYALRLLGDIAAQREPPQSIYAETHYQHALTMADELGMRPLQAHCHRGLGTLYCQTRQAEQARVELSIAIEMYRVMEMTFWLPETEAALAAVEGRWTSSPP